MTPTPKTRKELYLSKIAGNDTIIPDKPITREEMYLDEIARNGGGGGGGGGDIINYDTDMNGIIDNAEKVNGHTVKADVPADISDRVKAEVAGETLTLFK